MLGRREGGDASSVKGKRNYPETAGEVAGRHVAERGRRRKERKEGRKEGRKGNDERTRRAYNKEMEEGTRREITSGMGGFNSIS